ncbi:hypothetical protein [Kitasatospora sp. NPDC088134]|uniref:hypothetical protein n=1 Tax=Kitasatospora sp. NPDC088134 TaxID=3364071 RepID=UPI003802937A
MAALESLELPATAESIAAVIDSARDPAEVLRRGATSVRGVRSELRSLAGLVTRLTADQWYGRGVHVRVPADNPDLWWPTASWHRLREVRDERRQSLRALPTTGPADRTGGGRSTQGRRDPAERSEVAKSVDALLEANRAHYERHKNDFGPGAN